MERSIRPIPNSVTDVAREQPIRVALITGKQIFSHKGPFDGTNPSAGSLYFNLHNSKD